MKKYLFLLSLIISPMVLAKVPKVKMAQVSAAKAPTAQEMLNKINAIRSKPQKCGNTIMPAVAPLKWNGILAYSAQLHAHDMAHNQFYKHKNKQGLDPFERHKRDGYHGWGGVENIGAGSESLDHVYQDLLNSPLHCKTMMNQYITEMGMAFIYLPNSQYGNYWVQNFGIDPDTFYRLKGYPVERAKRLPFSKMFRE